MIMSRIRFPLLNLVLVAWTFPLIAETYYVRPDGNDQAEGKTPQTAFKTLLRARSRAEPRRCRAAGAGHVSRRGAAGRTLSAPTERRC